MKKLYIFVDESGNLDFSSRGTKYYILTLLSTTDPARIGYHLTKLRYLLLPEYRCGDKMEERGYFHASENKQEVRNYVFETLLKATSRLRVDAVIAQKNKANPTFHNRQSDLYRIMGEASLKYAFMRAGTEGHDHVVLVFSSLFDRKKGG